ncbi:MAG TPA: hypothetical protein VD978_15635 [Azospirillum sp.]|nr:hypothetical protein [Azospirillum sp.]
MDRPEDALIPLVAAAVLVQMLTSAPLRFDALFPPADAPKPPFVQVHTEPEPPAPPRPRLVRDEDDHFSGAS